MKKITFILLLSLMSFRIIAHDINYDKVILRQWHLVRENKNVEGSFNLYKDGRVYIDDANNKLVSFPLKSLSQQDQEFVLQKYKWVKQINSQNLHDGAVNEKKNQYLFDLPFFIVLLLLASIGFFVFIIAKNDKVKYLKPVFATGICIALFGFTNKLMKAMQLSSSPSTLDSAFVPFKPTINTYWDANYFYVESKGIPTTHNMMVGISNHGWQQQVPIPQCYIGANAWPIPLNPVLSANPIPVDSIHFTRGAIAIAVNGVPIFNVHTNTGVDSYIDGQLDNYGGHCGRADDYHYHIAPLHLYNYTTTNLPIAYGLDGYAVYGSLEPDGTNMQTLDANHGHIFNSTYHYHGTTAAPYMIARMAGNVTEDNTHQLIPQAAAHPVRPGLTPLNGALITACTPNANNNGYNVTYTRNGLVDSVVYNWSTAGQYTFRFYHNGNLDSLRNYNGFVQCTVPTTTASKEFTIINSLALIYPNPCNGIFNLQLNDGINSKKIKSITIFNMQGQLIFATNKYQPNIEIPQANKGVFLLNLEYENKKITQKIIVQ